MVNEDGPDEVVVPLVLLAQGGTLLLGILHQALNEVGTALTDHWGDGTVILQQPQVCEACKAGTLTASKSNLMLCGTVREYLLKWLSGYMAFGGGGRASVVLNCMQEGKLDSL